MTMPPAVTRPGRPPSAPTEGAACAGSHVPLVEVVGVSKRFGAERALAAVDLTVRAGAITALLGANGAGKSTLVSIMAGALRPDEGTVIVDGKPMSFRSTQDARRRGLAIVSQELTIFSALTVEENLLLTDDRFSLRRRGDRRTARGHASQILAELGLEVDLKKRAGLLPLADQQLLEIARALLQRPRLLILDEPTSALQQHEASRLHAVLSKLRDAGAGILYISHFLEEVLSVADRLVVLRDGCRVPGTIDPTTARIEDLVQAMLGEQEAPQPRLAAGRGEPFTGSLSIRGLEIDGVLSVADLQARRGEILGLAGLEGAGGADLLKVLFGKASRWTGTITLPDGTALPRRTSDLVKRGVALVPSDRKHFGLMLDRSVADNITQVRSLTQGHDGFLLSPGRRDATASRWCDELGIVHASTAQPVRGLSGGNQQKVVFAKWLEAEPEVVLLDDPTRGVDVRARQEMHDLIRRLAGRGAVVLLTSTDYQELAVVADRVVIFHDGRPREELSGDRLTEARILAAVNTTGNPDPVVDRVHEGDRYDR